MRPSPGSRPGATLTQRQPRALAGRIVAGSGVATGPDALTVVDDHAACYPPAVPGFGLEPLYPDRLGEDFLALRMPGHGHSDYVPDPWGRTCRVGCWPWRRRATSRP